ncbi:hypothetical protein BN1708_020293, partial [Verticillium longisporum]
ARHGLGACSSRPPA